MNAARLSICIAALWISIAAAATVEPVLNQMPGTSFTADSGGNATFEFLNSIGDVGTGGDQLAVGNHGHASAPYATTAGDADTLDGLDSPAFALANATAPLAHAHAEANATDAGFLSAANWLKLSGIAAGATAVNVLDDIGDVTATDPSLGEVLVFNTVSGSWENGKLNDVAVNYPLKFNGNYAGPDTSVLDVTTLDGTNGGGYTHGVRIRAGVNDAELLHGYNEDNVHIFRINSTTDKYATLSLHDGSDTFPADTVHMLDGNATDPNGVLGGGPLERRNGSVLTVRGAGGLSLETGGAVNAIATTVTDSDAALPTSGAVVDHVTGYAPQMTGADLSVTVGATGDYATINGALEALSSYYPLYAAGGVRGTITLQSGFTMAEQVVCDGGDLSWITITGTDANSTISRSALTTLVNGAAYPAFAAIGGCRFPTIDHLFDMDGSGASGGRFGMYVHGAGSSMNIAAGAGVANAAVVGLGVYSGGTVNADGAVFTGAGTNGVYSAGSFVSFVGGNAANAGSAGIQCTNQGNINAVDANATNAGGNGVRSYRASFVNFTGGDASGSATTGIIATNGGIIGAASATGTTSPTPNSVSAGSLILQ